MPQIPKTYTYNENNSIRKIKIDDTTGFTEVEGFTFYKCSKLEEIDMSGNTELKK